MSNSNRRVIRLNHANIPDTVVEMDSTLMFAWWFSKAHKATHILATGGAIVPVVESVDEINRIVQGSKTNGNEEGDR